MNTPPFLLGAAIVFWGALSGGLVLAITLAIALEAARLVPRRLELTDAQQRRIADVSTLIALAAGVFFYFASGFPKAAVQFFQWLPVALLPLALMQAYGAARAIDMRVLFWSLRRTTPREVKLVNIGYAYLILWVIAASASPSRGPEFDLGMSALAAWALWPWRARRGVSPAWVVLVAFAIALGYVASLGLRDLQLWIEASAPEWIAGGGTKVNPYRGTTDIGRFGELKMSDAIVLRIRPDFPLKPPLLLHQASYNDYVGENWIARGGTFQKIAPGTDARRWRLAEGAVRRSLVIDEHARQGDPVLSLARGAVEVSEFAASSLKRNPLGTVQGETAPGFVRYRVGIDPDGGDGGKPLEAELRIAQAERAAIERVAREWGLAGMAPAAAVDAIRAHFVREFAYATFQSAAASGATPLEDFLLRTRAGHCEHFASATTLLLRAAGIPARYATGYSIQEWSEFEGAWIARERHSHAWSRAYVDGKWIDVDSTPPTWLAIESRDRPAWAALADAWSWARFRYARWLGGAGDVEKALIVGVPAVIFLLWLGWRALPGWRAPKKPAGAAEDRRSALETSDSEFVLIVRHLERMGLARRPDETVRDWIARIAPRVPGDLPELSRLATLHYRLRFDPLGITAVERRDLAASAARWVNEIGSLPARR